MKILLVDESPIVLKFLEKILNRFNYWDIIKTHSAKEAFAILEERIVDLILLDWNIPNMDGLEFMKVLKSRKKTQKIPIIMITIEKSTEKIKKAIESGAEGFIAKPINTELLKIRLQDIESSNLLGLKK